MKKYYLEYIESIRKERNKLRKLRNKAKNGRFIIWGNRKKSPETKSKK